MQHTLGASAAEVIIALWVHCQLTGTFEVEVVHVPLYPRRPPVLRACVFRARCFEHAIRTKMRY